MTTLQLAKERQISKTRQWEQALNRLYTDYQDYCKKVLRDFDSEDVHQARVNSRKLLTLLSILDPGHSVTDELYGTLKQAQKRLGKVRDADVLIEAFKDKRKQAKEAGANETAELLKAVIEQQKGERKTYRRKLADKLPKLTGKSLNRQWESFLSRELEQLAAKRDANVVMRELEVAFEQKKKTCKALFKGPEAESAAAFDALHELRIAAKELRYTASAAAFALNQKFHADEEIYKGIQEQLGGINDRRIWLEVLSSATPDELGVSRRVWDEFTDSLRAEVLEALHHNEVVPFSEKPKQPHHS
ncbi:CHAD domain-containing protein [Paenibacillus sp. BAC0078]